MHETKKFRLLILLAAVSLLLGIYSTYAAPTPPIELQTLYDWRGYGAVIPGLFDERLWYVWLALSSLGLVGAYFFWRFARPLLLLPLFISVVRAGLGGIYVSAPIEDAAWSLYYVFSTLVIGMAFFSEPIRQHFGRSHEKSHDA